MDKPLLYFNFLQFILQIKGPSILCRFTIKHVMSTRFNPRKTMTGFVHVKKFTVRPTRGLVAASWPEHSSQCCSFSSD
jgi:hypothetical protein